MDTLRIEPAPCPAEATHGDRRVARSTAAVREDRAGAAPVLWFPDAHVDSGARSELPTGTWQQGEGDLAGFIAFDDEQVDVHLVEGTTRTRFPNWGDARDLIDVLDVQRTSPADGPTRYRSAARDDWRRPVVEGSQMLAQAVVATSRESPGRRVVAASMVFPRVADPRSEYAVVTDRVSEGRTFSSYDVRAVQGDRVCGTGSVLLDATAPAVIEHWDPMPSVARPEEATPYDMSVTGRDLRMVDEAYTGDPDAPVGPPEIFVWVRFGEVPDDQAIHAALLTQFMGHISIAAAMRPHAGVGQWEAHRSLSTAVNAISMSLHAEVHADEWMLYHHRSTFAGDGMTHSSCRVFTEDGGPLASFTTDCMVRGFADPNHVVDDRTSL